MKFWSHTVEDGAQDVERGEGGVDIETDHQVGPSSTGKAKLGGRLSLLEYIINSDP